MRRLAYRLAMRRAAVLLAFVCLACTPEQERSIMAALLLFVVGALTTATVSVGGVTWALVAWRLRARSTASRIACGLWSLVIAGAALYTVRRMDDLTLDPSAGDFWWSAWIVALAAISGAVSLAAALGGGRGMLRGR